MDVMINEIQSQVRATDTQAPISPAVFKQIVQACVRAVKEEQARENRAAAERDISAGVSSEGD